MDRIDDTLEMLVEKGKTPSVQYMLFTQDEIIHSFSAGYTDLVNQKKVNENTIFNVCVTLFVAAICSKLH